MMNETSSGSDRIPPTAGSSGIGISKSGSLSGDNYAPTLETSGTRSTGGTSSKIATNRRQTSRASEVAPKARHKCSLLFSSCVDSLDRALDHEEEFFLRNNALGQLKDALSELWDARADREEAYSEIVNMLQSVFFARNVEDLSTSQLVCLRSVFERSSQQLDFSDDFANQATLELLNGGVDVFRETQ